MEEVKVMIFNCNCFFVFSFTLQKARILCISTCFKQFETPVNLKYC